MDRFVLHSDFKPMGDQPQAIEALTKGFEEGNQFETLVGVTGSGKTFTLVERITYLITEKNISPENILISTFTEKAAKEIITRISNRLSDLDVEVNINDMYIGTLHSICLRILKDNLEYTRLKKNYRTFN